MYILLTYTCNKNKSQLVVVSCCFRVYKRTIIFFPSRDDFIILTTFESYQKRNAI